MAERRVSVDGTTYDLTPPFLLIATQNPVDHEGTFPLPEAQLDRFLVRLNLGYPSAEEEASMLGRCGSAPDRRPRNLVITAERGSPGASSGGACSPALTASSADTSST